MIYAVIVNELGLVGAAALLLVYLLFVARGLKTAMLARDSFSKLLATGLSFIVAMQVFVIVGGVTRVIPLTGVTLPFVAYGGSSVVMNFVLLALLLVVSDRARRPYRRPRAEWRRSARPSRLRSAFARPRRAPASWHLAQVDSRGAVEDRRVQMLTSTIARRRRGSFCARRDLPVHDRYRGLSRAQSHARRALLAGGPAPAAVARAPAPRARARICSCCTTSRSSRCEDGRVSHYEALVRLADEPGGRCVAPRRFLPAAERYGLIREIDRMVLGKVAALLGEQASHGARSACIASRSTCRRCRSPIGDMLAHIERAARRLAASIPSQLVVEVTETASISDMARAQGVLRRRAGARLRGRAR